MRRRAFLSVVCGAVAWPLAAAAQQSTNKKRLAIFSPSEPSADLHEHGSKFYRALFAELRRLGQIEGQNLKVESYGREQNTSGAEALATEIVRSNPDVIFVVGPVANGPKRSFCLEQTSCEQFDIASDQSPMVSVIGRGGYCHECRQKTLARQGKKRVFGWCQITSP